MIDLVEELNSRDVATEVTNSESSKLQDLARSRRRWSVKDLSPNHLDFISARTFSRKLRIQSRPRID
jgi:hypothetical protein